MAKDGRVQRGEIKSSWNVCAAEEISDGEGRLGHTVENRGCRMSSREPLKVTEQRNNESEAALYVGRWKTVWRERRQKTS